MTRLCRQANMKKYKKRAFILAVLMIILSVFDFFTSSASAVASHSTRLNLSTEQIKQNGNVTLTADAVVNGSAVKNEYTYRFLYNTDGGTSAYPLGDYSSQNWYTFKPSEIPLLKNYTGAVFIFADSKTGSTSVWSGYKILNIIPNDGESLKANGTVTSAGNYTVGDKLIVTMTATGGKSPYTYKYEYAKNGESYSTCKENTAISSITILTDSWTANTDYYIKVTVTDSDNKTFSYISAVSLSEKTVPVPTISSVSVADNAKIGDKLKINCNAAGGTFPLQYKFSYINSGNAETVIKDYSNSDSATWDTTGISEGNYTIKVIVKDSNGKTAIQKSSVKISKTPVLSPTISTDPINATVIKGKDITFTVDTHSDGSENFPPQPYKYKFEYKKTSASEYLPLKSYGSDEKYKYNTQNLAAGDYTLKATVKDGNGMEYSKTVKFTVEVPKITFNVSPGAKDFFTGGGNDKTVIEIKDVKGGISNEYEYKFEYVKYGSLTATILTPPTNYSAWQNIKDFSSESSADFKVNKDENAGIYAVRVSVQNKGNTNINQIYRQIIENYTVKVKVQHTLSDINALIDKVDTWTANSIQGDMLDKIKDWTPENSEHWSEYPFNYERSECL